MPATDGDPTVIHLDTPPDLAPLLGRIALGALPIPGLGGPGGGRPATTALPDTTIVLEGTSIDASHVAAYAEVCGFRLGTAIPPTYLHILGFPLSVQLMTRPDFPFGLIGMVHIRNRITVHRPVGLEEVVDVTARVTDLRPHPKGRQMDNVVTAAVGGEVVWESSSTYLKRGARSGEPGELASPLDGVEVDELPLTSVWRVPKDIGRRYAAVSGDRNPIHLSALSARAFGFPRAIAHGMWTKARCLAALEGRLPEAFTADVAFKLPLLLPRTVEYATTRSTDDGWALGVRSRDGKPHLAGLVTSA